MANVKPIPEGMNSLTPHITVKNAKEAIKFYTDAFGAKEMSRALTPGRSTETCASGASERTTGLLTATGVVALDCTLDVFNPRPYPSDEMIVPVMLSATFVPALA